MNPLKAIQILHALGEAYIDLTKELNRPELTIQSLPEALDTVKAMLDDIGVDDKPEIKEGARVRVQNGDGSEDRGLGTYLGEVTVFAFVRKGKGGLPEIRSMHDAETMPDEKEQRKLQAEGYTLAQLNDNPKIKLDSGETVYGCQVWWEPVHEGVTK